MEFKLITNKHSFYKECLLFFSFLLLIIPYSLTSEIRKANGNEEQIIKDLFKNNKDTIPFKVIYVLDRIFCYKCFSVELKSGWFEVPKTMKEQVSINILTSNPNISNYMNNRDSNSYSVIKVSDKKLTKFKKFKNKAVFYDRINDIVFEYKPSSNDFQLVYKYFDSVLFNDSRTKFINTAFIDSTSFYTDIPYYVNNIKLTFNLQSKSLQIYSPKEANFWQYDLNGNLLDKISLYRSDERERIKIEPTSNIYNDFFRIENRLMLNTLLLSNPIDTFQFNRETRKFRKVNQQIHFMSIRGDSIELDSIIDFTDHIGTFKKSINSNIIWGVNYLLNRDTSEGIFKLFYINNNSVNTLNLPLKFYSGNPEFSCSYDSKLYTFNQFGKIFIIDTNKNAKAFDVSYLQRAQRKSTFFDGSFFSITSHDGEYSYLSVYNKFGMRCFNFSTQEFNAYYLYLSTENIIVTISKDMQSDSNWKVVLFKFEDLLH